MKPGSKLSAESRAKISEAARRRPPISDETRAKMAAASRRRKHSAETKAKIAAAIRGRKHSLEAKAKISAAHKGVPKSADHKAKMSAARRGERNHNWLGDDVGYDAIHGRADKVLPMVCAQADDTCKGRLEAAFNHDTPDAFVKVTRDGRYSVRAEDYIRLCVSHHARYDKGRKVRRGHPPGLRAKGEEAS